MSLHPTLRIETIVSAPFEENAYMAALPEGQACIVFDPGFEPQKIIEFLLASDLIPTAILNTHGHSDHIAGNAALLERWPNCTLLIGAGDAAKLSDPVKNLSAGYGISVTSPPASRQLVEGDIFELAGIELEVLDVPGHSCGHIAFLWRSGEPWIVFGGDVLFSGSIGRSDFPDGDHEQLLTSIREKLFTLPDDTLVLPGHGPPTTVGQERRTNPFLK